MRGGVFILSKVKKLLKCCMPTLCYFIVLSMLFFFLPLMLFLLIGMSTDAGMNSLSIYVLEDVLNLIGVFFMPFITIGLFYGIPGIVMFIFRRKLKFNLIVYVILMFLYSLPFGVMVVSVHGNTSLEYKVEREKEILIRKGYIIEGTDWFDICNRYLSTDDLGTIRSLLELDSTVLSYDYRYISDYMDYIKFIDVKIAMKRLEDYYGVDYIDDSYIVFDKSLLELSEILNTFRCKSDLTVDEVHNKLTEFISGKSNTKGDGLTIDDDLNRTIPLMVTFENIKLLGDASKLSDKSAYMQNLVLKSEIGFTLNRVESFVKGNAYDYQYGDTITIEDDKLYKEYTDKLNMLLEEDNLTVDYVQSVLKGVNSRYGLDIEDRELNDMQIFFNQITLEEIEIQNEKGY